MPEVDESAANCFAILRTGVVMAICPTEHVANWIMEAMKQRQDTQSIPSSLFRYKVVPWFIDGGF